MEPLTTIIKQTKLPGDVKGVVLISTVRYNLDGKFETLAMDRNYLDHAASLVSDESEALASHAEMVKNFTAATAPRSPLTGKYARLRDDLKAAAEIARAAAEQVDDKGTCNFDAVSLHLPRWNSSCVKQAAEEAGLGCFAWKLYGQKRYVFLLYAGQAYKQETAGLVMTEQMEKKGYDAFFYQEMD